MNKLMVTIISGTHRKGSNTLKLAKEYQRILEEKGLISHLFSLEKVALMERAESFRVIENEIIKPTTHFIFIIPEYNGSFPGVLKMLFDTSGSHEIWFNKKALLTGNSTGRAGNLRGMDHLADILNYLKITVHPNKLPISLIDKVLDKNGAIKDKGTLGAVSNQLDEFIGWM